MQQRKVQFQLPKAVLETYKEYLPGNGTVIFKEPMYSDEMAVKKKLPPNYQMDVFHDELMRVCIERVGDKALSITDGTVDAFFSNLPAALMGMLGAAFSRAYSPFETKILEDFVGSRVEIF